MAKLTLNDITSEIGFANNYNANNTLIEAALENTLSRDGTTPNQMGADLDMNSNNVNNVGVLRATSLTLNGVPVTVVGTGVTALAGLSDIDISVPAARQVLIYDGTDSWDNGSLAFDDLSDVSVSTATDGQLLTRAAGSWVGVDQTTFSLEVEDEGVSVATNVTKLNFKGAFTLATQPVAGEIDIDIENQGIVLQTVNVIDGELATGTNTIPEDDTIPQNTQGDEYMTRSITPESATSVLRIDVNAVVSHSDAGHIFIMGLFQDTTADALASVFEFASPADAPTILNLTYWMTSGTTSPTTFKVRIGSETNGTTTFNGRSGGRRFGGTMASSITITEYAQ